MPADAVARGHIGGYLAEVPGVHAGAATGGGTSDFQRGGYPARNRPFDFLPRGYPAVTQKKVARRSLC